MGMMKKKWLECCTCSGDVCCPERCRPYFSELYPGTCTGAPGENPFPASVTCTITVATVKNDPITGLPTGCYTCTGSLVYSPAVENWIGFVEGTCTGWCGGTTRLFQYEVRLSCGDAPSGLRKWYATISDYIDGDPTRVCTAPNIDSPVLVEFTSECSPIMLSGQSTSFFCGDLACIIPILGIDEFFGDVVFDVLIVEEP